MFLLQLRTKIDQLPGSTRIDIGRGRNECHTLIANGTVAGRTDPVWNLDRHGKNDLPRNIVKFSFNASINRILCSRKDDAYSGGMPSQRNPPSPKYSSNQAL